MGAQVSVSQSYVKDVLSASTSVINKIISETSTPTDMTQIVNFEGCTDVSVGTINQSQLATMDVTATLKALQSTEASAAVESAVTALAQAETTGGFGFNASDSQTVVNKSIALSAAVLNVAQNSLDASIKQSQVFQCKNSSGLSVNVVDQSQVAHTIARSVADNSQIAQISQDIKDTIDATAKSKATGYDPMGIAIILLAVVCVGGLGALWYAGKLGTSMNTWMLVSALGSAFSLMIFCMSFAGIWPSVKVDPDFDSESELKAKRKQNNIIRAVTGTTTGVFGALAAGLFYYSRKSKKQDQSSAVRTPSGSQLSPD